MKREHKDIRKDFKERRCNIIIKICIKVLKARSNSDLIRACTRGLPTQRKRTGKGGKLGSQSEGTTKD
jgi:hypothetical protein